MAARTLLSCLLLATASLAGPQEADPKADPAFQASVDESIAKGVKWLLSRQEANGCFPSFTDTRGAIYPLGMHALGVLTVIKGGHPIDSPELERAFRALDTLYATNRNNLHTYEAGVLLMALDAKYLTPKRGKKPPHKPKVSAADLELAKEVALWLQRQQRPEGLWRYPEGGQDLSNTQYAALGLWSAHRLGVEVDKGVVRRMLEETLARQQEDGGRVPFIQDPRLNRAHKGEHRSSSTIKARGWRYMPEEEVEQEDGTMRKVPYPYSGSMTSAGIAILGIGRDILGDKDAWLDKSRDRQLRMSMWEGLAWLQKNWDLRDNPGQPGNWPFYWIYGLERCARLSGVEFVGEHDWYYEGAVRLVADQRPDGSWPKTQRMRPKGDQNVRWWSDQVDTCFAILFLTRSTPEIRTPPPAITGD